MEKKVFQDHPKLPRVMLSYTHLQSWFPACLWVRKNNFVVQKKSYQGQPFSQAFFQLLTAQSCRSPVFLPCCKWEPLLTGFSESGSQPHISSFLRGKERKTARAVWGGNRQRIVYVLFLCCLSRHPLLTPASVWETFNLGEAGMAS